ncbi:MAG: hypothetical protein JSV35_07495 [Candidatus Bathyarchaeota archaeon]|nr:MAG: hypothetical protein JSV35_07495 [Candidatus Bathyarchaeota archaeon]
MTAKIAVVTVSGKAYYLLVNELKRRRVIFLSLTPAEEIPPEVRAVLTTGKERSMVTPPTNASIVVFEENADPVTVVDEAIRQAERKPVYENLVIGVDPGENFGLAVLGDGRTLETRICTSSEETIAAIQSILSRIPATQVNVRIGDGAMPYSQDLLRSLSWALPEHIVIENVGEEGTSRSTKKHSHRRTERDKNSAVRIGQRKGRVVPRRRIKR